MWSRTVNNVPDILQTRATYGPSVRVHVGGLRVDVVQENVAANVENRIDTRSNEGKRCRRDGGIH